MCTGSPSKDVEDVFVALPALAKKSAPPVTRPAASNPVAGPSTGLPRLQSDNPRPVNVESLLSGPILPYARLVKTPPPGPRAEFGTPRFQTSEQTGIRRLMVREVTKSQELLYYLVEAHVKNLRTTNQIQELLNAHKEQLRVDRLNIVRAAEAFADKDAPAYQVHIEDPVVDEVFVNLQDQAGIDSDKMVGVLVDYAAKFLNAPGSQVNAEWFFDRPAPFWYTQDAKGNEAARNDHKIWDEFERADLRHQEHTVSDFEFRTSGHANLPIRFRDAQYGMKTGNDLESFANPEPEEREGHSGIPVNKPSSSNPASTSPEPELEKLVGFAEDEEESVDEEESFDAEPQRNPSAVSSSYLDSDSGSEYQED